MSSNDIQPWKKFSLLTRKYSTTEIKVNYAVKLYSRKFILNNFHLALIGEFSTQVLRMQSNGHVDDL